MADLTVTVVTFQEIFQSEAQETGRHSDMYRKMSALIHLDKGDAGVAGIKDGSNVRVSSSAGSVVVAAKIDSDEPHPKVAFMPNSPWSNQLVSSETGTSRIPDYKSIQAEISPSSEPVTGLDEILRNIQMAGK